MALMEYLKELVERNASDLHLVAGSPPMIRINGELLPLEHDTNVLGRETVGTLFEPFFSDTQQAMLRNRQDVHTSLVSDIFSSTQYGDAQRFRVCAFWDRHGIGASLRVIPTKIPTLDQLFTPEAEVTFRKLANLRRGLVLVVGPVGSGKSTTVAAMIETINTERCERIFTIEDPIEYAHSSKKSLISQREVGSDVESYEQGGISVMRADPDVVLVGELRTPEAVRIALALAETGHLVFSTIHAESASEAVRRMIEAFPDARDTMQSLVARSLQAVIGQRLVPRAARIGRAPANEIMLMNSRIRRMIGEGQTDLTVAIEAGRDEGMRTMDDSLLSLYRDGTISYEAAWLRIEDRERLGPRPLVAEEPATA